MRQAEGRHREFDDPGFLARLRQGEPGAYRVLVRRLHGSLVGVAAAVIGSRAQAEEVVQDTWLAVFSGIGRFEGRSSLTTWLFSIVLNRARTRAAREGRLVALPALEGGEPGERAVPRSAFQPDGHWIEPPRLWDELNPERVVGGRQLWEHVQAAIERLPAGQRAVLLLRDIEGCSAEDTCALLELTPENQRVLLHRARGRIRAMVDALPGMRAVPAAVPMATPSAPPVARRVLAALRWSLNLTAGLILGRETLYPCVMPRCFLHGPERRRGSPSFAGHDTGESASARGGTTMFLPSAMARNARATLVVGGGGFSG